MPVAEAVAAVGQTDTIECEDSDRPRGSVGLASKPATTADGVVLQSGALPCRPDRSSLRGHGHRAGRARELIDRSSIESLAASRLRPGGTTHGSRVSDATRRRRSMVPGGDLRDSGCCIIGLRVRRGPDRGCAGDSASSSVAAGAADPAPRATAARPGKQAAGSRRGDRGGPDDEVRPGRDEQADRVEPVPLRRDRQGGRDRLRPLLGHDRGEALPDRQRLGGRRVRLRQRRPARHLLRHRDAPARWAPPRRDRTGSTRTWATTASRT